MMQGRRILMLDGARERDTALQAALETQGYLVLQAADAAQTLAQVRSTLPDLVMLGGMLPSADHLGLLRAIRALSAVPLIVLSVTQREDDAVQALHLGADDVVATPLSPRELLARIASVLRRAAAPAAVPPGALVIDAEVTIDFGRNRVIVRGAEVALTAHEYRLLYHLVSNAGRLMPYDALLARVWGPEYQGDVHYVRLYVSYLRAKIEPDARHPKYILTEKGLGYRFTEGGQAAAMQRPDAATTPEADRYARAGGS